MALSYNVRFRKLNASGRILLEKDGEVILMDRGLRLRGKGAHDHVVLLPFTEMREFTAKDDSLFIMTFARDRYEIAGLAGMFDGFLRDIYQVRNEFLVDALFLKQGKLLTQAEAYFERSNPSRDLDMGAGRAKIRLYEQSVVVVPDEGDAFGMPFDFMTMQDFDDDAYSCTIAMEYGTQCTLSQFGNGYEEFQEGLYGAMSHMYEGVINELQYLFIDFPQEKIVKLAHLLRRGKAVCLQDIAKIDKVLAQKAMDNIYKDEMFQRTISPIASRVSPENIFLGFDVFDGKKDIYRFSALFALPEENIFTMTLGSYEKDVRKVQDTYFFRIVMEKGDMETCLKQRVMELNQACLLLHFVPDPLYKDRRELKNSMYSFAIQKLSCLRMLRSAFLGRCPSILPDLFNRNLERVLEKSRVAVTAPAVVE